MISNVGGVMMWCVEDYQLDRTERVKRFSALLVCCFVACFLV